MSRTFMLLVIALFATTIIGCGDKEGDDASSEVSSNNSGGGSSDTGSSDLDNSGSGNSDVENVDPNAINDPDYIDPNAINDPDYIDPNAINDPDYIDPNAINDPDYIDPNAINDPDYIDPNAINDPDYIDPNAINDPDYIDPNAINDPDYIDPNARRTPKTYSDHARLAFEQGHDDLALKYTYAAILTDTDAAKNQKLQFWAGPGKPTMAIRWGVGINYTAPKNLTSRPPMIGDKPNLPERGQDGDTRNNTGSSRVFGRKNRDDVNSGDTGYIDGGDGTGAGDGSGGGKFRLPSDSWGQLLYLTGNVGERFIERLDMRRTRGYYGDMLKLAPPVQHRRTSADDGGGTDDYSIDSGTEDYGDGGQGSGQTGPQLIPGVTMLGLGSSKELLSRAEQQGLDVVLVFEVAYSKTLRTSIERNDTGMRLYLVADGRELRKVAPLNNLAVWNERENLKNDKDDPVDLAIDSLLSSFADEHIRVSDLPNLNAEKAKIRVTSLTEKKVADPLPVLAEIKYYHTQHWLTDSELADAFKQVMGDDGLQLATGSLEDQKNALATYLGVDLESPITPSGTNTGGFR